MEPLRELAEFHDVQVGDRVIVHQLGVPLRVRIVGIRDGHAGLRVSVSFKRAKPGVKYAQSVGSSEWSRMKPVWISRADAAGRPAGPGTQLR